MSKDPAFLFYSTDYYEGTRLLTPEERACYVDLLIYQHQHNYIPDDPKRLSLYCSGLTEQIVKDVLKAKFIKDKKGWYNLKLKEVVDNRREFSIKQSGNGLVGQFFKKAKKSLNSSDYGKVKDYIYSDYTKNQLVIDLTKDDANHEAMLKAMLKHLENENENRNEDNNKGSKKPLGDHLFKNSPYFDIKLFKEEMSKDPKYKNLDLDHYHESAKLYSDQGNMYKNWISAVKSWIRRDLKKIENNSNIVKPKVNF